MNDAPKPRSDAVMKAIQNAIDEAKLAYAFRAGSYTMSALNAVLALEQVYLREADRLAEYLEPAQEGPSCPRCEQSTRLATLSNRETKASL